MDVSLVGSAALAGLALVRYARHQSSTASAAACARDETLASALQRVDALFLKHYERDCPTAAPGAVLGVVLDGRLVHVVGTGTLRVSEDANGGDD